MAIAESCDGVICGHIHQPAIREIGNLIYMNSGDWVESMTALVEDYFGNWEIIYFKNDENEELEEIESAFENLKVG